uniref:Uncharacterized protein n=1 Tax=Naja naja TaxID=35670 RepID=A0A8C6VEQ7_NAJNA
MMEQPWWKGDLAADVHQTLRLKVRLDSCFFFSLLSFTLESIWLDLLWM